MNKIPSQKKDLANDVRSLGEEIQEGIYPHHHEVNITDGAEFIDDAIRMKDQPLREVPVKEMSNPSLTTKQSNIFN